MDHLVIPLDDAHAQVVAQLGDDAAGAAGLAAPVDRSAPHVTVAAFEAPSAEAVRAAVAEVAAATAPFLVHAHGYGFFAGDQPSELTLHVVVARSPALDALHHDLCDALRGAGADVAGWSVPDVWLPHVTLLDRGLDPAGLGRAVAWLSRRHHPSWRIPVDRLALTGGWPDRRADVLPLEG